MMIGSAAYADRGRGHGHGHGGGGNGTGRASGGVVVRDHRGGGPTVVRGGGPVVRDHRGPARVRVSRGRYVFPGGVVRTYRRPVIRERYYDMHVRPAIVVESYDPVPGYVWVAGGWNWGGAEWVWTPGYWAIADEPPPPVVTGGFSINAGISIH
jgi:hypothetical protein